MPLMNHQRRDNAITLFVLAGVPVLIGLGMWTIPTTHAFVPSAGLDPFGMMTTVKVLPAAQYDDYSVVFNRLRQNRIRSEWRVPSVESNLEGE